MLNKTVMIVDDSRFMRSLLKKILISNGYTVTAEAGSGEEAIKLFQSHSPHIVLLDITLPRMNGVTTLKAIKSINAYVHVIMCSALGFPELITAALKNGAAGFIVKPFFDDLIPLLNKLD